MIYDNRPISTRKVLCINCALIFLKYNNNNDLHDTVVRKILSTTDVSLY